MGKRAQMSATMGVDKVTLRATMIFCLTIALAGCMETKPPPSGLQYVRRPNGTGSVRLSHLHGGPGSVTEFYILAGGSLAYADREDYDRAVEDYQGAIRANADDAGAYCARGNSYHDKALLQPDRAQAYAQYGLVHEDRDRAYYEKMAIEDYSKAIELRPDCAEAYNNRGVAYVGKGEYDKAAEDYAKAIQLSPKYARAYYNRGNRCLFRGEYEKAIEDYNKAIQLKPDFVEAHYNRAVACEEGGRLPEAARGYERFIGLASTQYAGNDVLSRQGAMFMDEARERARKLEAK